MFKNYSIAEVRSLNNQRSIPYVAYHQNLRSEHLLVYFGSHEGKFAGMTNVQSLNCNGLFIRSDRAKWYVQDYGPLGKDPIELSYKINTFVKSKKHIKTITLAGFSMGAYGALLFSTWVSAQKVVATAPQTRFPDYLINKEMPVRNEGFPPQLFDISDSWNAWGVPKMRVILQSCDKNCENETFRDVDEVLRLSKQYNSIETILLPCSGHKGITPVLLNKKLEYEKMFLAD